MEIIIVFLVIGMFGFAQYKCTNKIKDLTFQMNLVKDPDEKRVYQAEIAKEQAELDKSKKAFPIVLGVTVAIILCLYGLMLHMM